MTNIIESEVHRDYFRATMYSELAEHFLERPLIPGVGVEFGGGSNHIIQGMCHGTAFTELPYPQYDITNKDSWMDSDIVIADQVLEHVREPWKVFECASQSVKQALIITVPFLLKIHCCPGDFWRMTPECIRSMGQSAGFSDIYIDSWGTASAVYWVNHYWDTWRMKEAVPEAEWRAALIENDVENPIMIWAVLRK